MAPRKRTFKEDADAWRTEHTRDLPEAPMKFPVQDVSHPRESNKIFALINKEVVPTNWPDQTFDHIARNDLEIVENGDGTAQGTLQKKPVCYFCKEQRGPQNDVMLLTCDGQMSGEMRDGEVMSEKDRPFRPCGIRFHRTCASTYNADDYNFQYAARFECQGKILCPLHCCGACNVEHQKQSAYVPMLTQCAICLRAFHSECCLPGGAKPLNVAIRLGRSETSTFRMIVCPAHQDTTGTVIQKHLESCCEAGCPIEAKKNKEFENPKPSVPKPKKTPEEKLQQCKKCIRSFHPSCKATKKINNQDAPADICDNCVCQDTISVGVTVIALCPKTKKFQLGKVIRPTDGQLGMMEIKWLHKNRPASYPEKSLVPNSEVAEMRKCYLRIAAAGQLKFWAEEFKHWDEHHLMRCPKVYKKVFLEVKTSVYARKSKKMNTLLLPDVCKCGPNKNCERNECENHMDGRECPPHCASKKSPGFTCNNQLISLGYVHPGLEVRKTEEKGQGVFATEDIKEGEFLAGVHGEICDPIESKKRMEVIESAFDYQCNNYSMTLVQDYTMDMGKYGNITRYVNHSCDPNSELMMDYVFVEQRGKKLFWESRCYLEARKDIPKGTEVTIAYGFDRKNLMIDCKCRADNCTQDMSTKPELDKKVKTKKAKPGKGRKRGAQTVNAPPAKKAKK
ncbi:hypothetical protein CAEBREN_14179 [Caenorhabditis brenneri]|uniref:SET domain-containing protein n=1 Tax=Caenorhabditis brenneri TaxID=135651 RepID=G0P2I9_CAEBE|nr:hypothetical protein CAEBREN_14179 [Caenorhabditis brenneri]